MTYTGTGSAGTCGHGLGAVPDTIITKRRDGSGEWTIYNKNLDNASSTSHRVQRFKAIAQTGSSAAYYGNDPTNLVQHQAKLAKKARLDAIVFSPHELKLVRKVFKGEIVVAK